MLAIGMAVTLFLFACGVLLSSVSVGAETIAEHPGAIKAQGKPLTLLGNPVQVGAKAPSFEAVDNSMKPRKLDEFAGKVVVIVSVPSLDTKVCDIETRRFNQEAGKLGKDVVILTLSMDLPFAQKRWCGAAGIDAITTLSDYRERSFGTAYGLLIKENKLLARAVVVVDREGTVRYVQVVDELSHEPDYEAALAAARKAAE